MAIVTTLLTSQGSAAPQLLRQDNIIEETGPPIPYSFSYTIRDEINGVLMARIEEQDEEGVVRGSYTYVRPDGIITTTSYVADKDGFRSETREESAGGLEKPNPNGSVQVYVKMPDAEEYGYQFTAQEYKDILKEAAF
ncbi:hypothetical protein SK128_021172 [Halocaridina rubra]|uniref:Uncharacterized protein n=1 Tax=Halocaridina rubra TaxID=373956 RepID=A0AAN8ZTR9_HALRR